MFAAIVPDKSESAQYFFVNQDDPQIAEASLRAACGLTDEKVSFHEMPSSLASALHLLPDQIMRWAPNMMLTASSLSGPTARK
jgi:hypothetical protein